MIAGKRGLIRRELEEGTGASINVILDSSGFRSSLRIWFNDIDEKNGPVAELKPHGLKGHLVELTFGPFSKLIIEQIKKASSEDVILARSLILSIGKDMRPEVKGQDIDNWLVADGSFKITSIVRNLENPFSDENIVATCREVIVPIMAAMAELIGYDVMEDNYLDTSPSTDGKITEATIKRRERNPRNKLLCIRIHGEMCKACGLDPKTMYHAAGHIIEVHHLEPLASLAEPRPYNPNTDLIPLCPNCHRAVHTRRPFPLSIEELRNAMGNLNE